MLVMLLVTHALCLLLLVPRSEAAVCTVAPGDVHFAITWPKQLSVGCWSHTLTKTAYQSLHEAHRACEHSPACSGVHDAMCVGVLFYLCDSAHNLTAPGEKPDAPPCVYVKPAPVHNKVASGTNLSARVAGRWCSTWCCCPPHFHGLRCDNYDECASAPCQNGGSCSESFTDPRVNDYLRRYRCECASEGAFSGHNCEKDSGAARATADPRCKMQVGADSASGSTSTVFAYHQFQAALEYLSTTIKSSTTDFQRFCTSVYTMHTQGGVCAQRITLYDKQGAIIGSPILDCKHRPEVYVMMGLCATPCMLDKHSVCCLVPAEVAYMFPCCRALYCCPDQSHQGARASDPGTVGSRRALALAALAASGTNGAPGFVASAKKRQAV